MRSSGLESLHPREEGRTKLPGDHCEAGGVTLSPEEVLLVKNERESLYKAIDKLCEEDRILILMTLAEKSQIEIAEALGLKRQSNVRYRKLRALGQLKTLLIGKEGFIIS